MSTACLAVAALLACTNSTPAAQQKQKQKKKAESPFAAGVSVGNGGVAEPSGIAFHPRLGHLFVVGDEGSLAELDHEGRVQRTGLLGGNLEDVAVHLPSGHLVLLDEVEAALAVYDPATWTLQARWPLDTDAVVGTREKGRHGFEGLAFRPEAGRPGGGVFYLTHQRGPALLVAIAFDPAAAPHTLDASDVVGRWRLGEVRDLTAVTWSAALERLLVLADSEDELLVLTRDGDVQARLPLPGVNQEGVCLDAAGDLWITDDRGRSVVRYPGAKNAIETALPTRRS